MADRRSRHKKKIARARERQIDREHAARVEARSAVAHVAPWPLAFDPIDWFEGDDFQTRQANAASLPPMEPKDESPGVVIYQDGKWVRASPSALYGPSQEGGIHYTDPGYGHGLGNPSLAPGAFAGFRPRRATSDEDDGRGDGESRVHDDVDGGWSSPSSNPIGDLKKIIKQFYGDPPPAPLHDPPYIDAFAKKPEPISYAAYVAKLTDEINKAFIEAHDSAKVLTDQFGESDPSKMQYNCPKHGWQSTKGFCRTCNRS